MPQQKKTLKLPKRLVEELGGQDLLSRGRTRAIHSSRKETRKAARKHKKESKNDSPQKRRKIEIQAEDRASLNSTPVDPVVRARPNSVTKNFRSEKPRLKSTETVHRENANISKAVQQKLNEDDAEIAALESRLGIKKTSKLPRAFEDDGLTELLEGLGEESLAERERRRIITESDEWLGMKRMNRKDAVRRKENLGRGPRQRYERLDEADNSNDGQVVLYADENLESRDKDDQEETPSSDEEIEGVDRPPTRVKENPYIAPIISKPTAAKYIPPSVRQASASDNELSVRLRRQTQGLINRLTEANLLSIIGECEKLYRDNPRQLVKFTLVDILMTAICEPTTLPDTLIILHAGFIAALYKVLGMDFGAHVVETIVKLLDQHYESASEAKKETSNLLALLSGIYNFQVIGSNLVFDYIKILLGTLSELNAELLLKIIRASGPQLRQDDPSSLKDMISMLRPAVASVGVENLSVRTKFMLEALDAVKNNRVRTGVAASTVNSEHIVRMKKMLGSLNTKSIEAREPLRIGLKDIKESDKRGKWWIVGASWTGSTKEEQVEDHAWKQAPLSKTVGKNSRGDTELADLLQLATEQRMNTDIRRSIFIALISASDYQDASLRIGKLKLKKAQELEIPKVLCHCAKAEESYSPYYTLIAKNMCGDRKFRMAFQFCLWSFFKKLEEAVGEDGMFEYDQGEAVDTRHIVNLAKTFGSLVADGALGLSILKNLNLVSLQPKTKSFVEVLFITLFLRSQVLSNDDRNEKAVSSVIRKAKDTPHLVVSLQYFLEKVVSRTEIVGSKADGATVKWACKVALSTLEGLEMVDTQEDR